MLKIPEDSDQNSVRRAYIEMVKKVHPDADHEESSLEKFKEVDECFRFLLQKFAKARRNIEMNPEEEVKVFDIKHTAPQHRMFLSNDGYGIGTPFQREKQYQQIRAMRAQQNVFEHRMQKVSATEGAIVKKGEFFKKHAVKTKYGIDRVVEDLIQEAIHRGDFSNLKGQGKPLEDKQSQNPYVDFVTHKINNILLENGFTPEFIMLHKEIREEIQGLKDKLKVERQKLKFPADTQDEMKWQSILKEYQEVVKDINKKIDKFNLIVPILNKQMVQITLKRIGDAILQEEPEKYYTETPNKLSEPSDYNKNFLSFISSIFKEK